MNKSVFINRVDDIEYLLSQIQSVEKRNKVIFLSGDSGVGKSAFTRKVIEEQPSLYGIKIKAQDFSGTVSEGFFIERIAKEIHEYSDHNKCLCTFDHYFNMEKSKEIRKRNYDIFSKALISSIPKVDKLLQTARDRIFHLNDFDYNRLFNSGITEVVLVLKAYIEYILLNYRAIINIENVQVIDKTSLNILLELLKSTSSNLFILEFTSNSPKSVDYVQLVEFFEDDRIEIAEKKLEKLSFKDYVRIINKKGIEKLLESSYIQFNGDLRKLVDIKVTLEADPTFYSMLDRLTMKTFDPTNHHLKSLKKTEKIILTSIIAHKASVPIDNLASLYKVPVLADVVFDLDLVLDSLIKEQLIFKQNSIISISHDSISQEVLTDDTFIKFLAISFKAWISYYERLLNNQEFSKLSKEKILSYLFHFYCYSQPKALFSLLPEIRSIAIQSIYPDTAIDYIESLRESIIESEGNYDLIDEINFSIIDIYYYLGIFDSAYSVLEKIRNKSSRFIAYKAALLDRLDKHDDAIKYINSILTTMQVPPRLELTLKLIMFISSRSVLMIENCIALFDDINGNPKYREYLEYGYFLRNAEIILSLADGLKYVSQSVVFFRDRGLNIQEGHSLITLALMHAWSGNLEEALISINMAESILLDNTLERHIIFNDKAAIRIYQGLLDHEVEALLKRARETAIMSFDKLSIYINLLIFYSFNREDEKSDATVEIILTLLEKQPDLVMHRVAYFNIWYYYKASGEHNLAEKFINKAKNIHDQLKKYDSYDESWESRFYPERAVESEYDFVLRYDFEPCFISYWHFEISKDY